MVCCRSPRQPTTSRRRAKQIQLGFLLARSVITEQRQVSHQAKGLMANKLIAKPKTTRIHYTVSVEHHRVAQRPAQPKTGPMQRLHFLKKTECTSARIRRGWLISGQPLWDLFFRMPSLGGAKNAAHFPYPLPMGRLQ